MHTHRTAHIATYLWLTAGWNRLNSCSMSGGRRARLLPAHKQYVDGAYSSVCKARRKRLMTYVHRCKRIQWTRRYTSWNCMMLEKVMFSDESISCLFGTKPTSTWGGLLEKNLSSAECLNMTVQRHLLHGVAWLIVKLNIIDGAVNVTKHIDVYCRSACLAWPQRGWLHL